MSDSHHSNGQVASFTASPSRTYRCILVYLACVLVLVVIAEATTVAQDLPMLMEPAEVSFRPQEVGRLKKYLRDGGRTAKIRLNVELLLQESPFRAAIHLPSPTGQQDEDGPNDRLAINLDATETTSGDGPIVAWIGTVDGTEASDVAFVVSRDYVHGVVAVPGHQYWIQPAITAASGFDHLYDLLDIDARKLPEEEPPLGCQGDDDADRRPKPQERSGTARIRVLVLATEALWRDQPDGGLALVVRLIFANLNSSMRRSEVKIEFDSLGPVRLKNSPEKSCKKMLQRLRQQDVANLRHEHGADLVTLLTRNAGKCAARAFVMNRADLFDQDPFYHRTCAFSVVEWSLARDLSSLAHEIGHNMGLGHHWGGSQCIRSQELKGLFGDSLGHCETGCGLHRASFRTIMAIDDSKRINQFANPNVKYKSCPTGIEGKANAAMTLNKLRWIIADYED